MSSLKPEVFAVNPDAWIRISRRLRARLVVNGDGSVTWIVEPWRRNLCHRIVSAGTAERVYRRPDGAVICTCQTVSHSAELCEHQRGLERAGLLVVLSLHAAHETPSPADRQEHAAWGSQDALYGVAAPAAPGDPPAPPSANSSTDAKAAPSGPTPEDWHEYEMDRRILDLEESLRKLTTASDPFYD